MRLIHWFVEECIQPLFLIATVCAMFLILTSSVAAAPSDPEVIQCPLWATAGAQEIYRCEDEQTGEVCFSQSVMLFCLTD